MKTDPEAITSRITHDQAPGAGAREAEALERDESGRVTFLPRHTGEVPRKGRGEEAQSPELSATNGHRVLSPSRPPEKGEEKSREQTTTKGETMSITRRAALGTLGAASLAAFAGSASAQAEWPRGPADQGAHPLRAGRRARHHRPHRHAEDGRRAGAVLRHRQQAGRGRRSRGPAPRAGTARRLHAVDGHGLDAGDRARHQPVAEATTRPASPRSASPPSCRWSCWCGRSRRPRTFPA